MRSRNLKKEVKRKPTSSGRDRSLDRSKQRLIETSDSAVDTMLAARFVQFGHAIKEQRRIAGLTQTQLAHFAGCGLIFIHQLEHGKPTVRLNTVLEVLRVLGLELNLQMGPNQLLVDPALLKSTQK